MAVLAAAGFVLLVLVVAQLLLPGIAAQELRNDLAQSGTVLEVKVSAFPAIKLLWHRADSVVVRMGRYRAAVERPRRHARRRGRRATRSTHRRRSSTLGPLTLRDATLRKRGGELTGSATVTAGGPALGGVLPRQRRADRVRKRAADAPRDRELPRAEARPSTRPSPRRTARWWWRRTFRSVGSRRSRCSRTPTSRCSRSAQRACPAGSGSRPRARCASVKRRSAAPLEVAGTASPAIHPVTVDALTG